MTKILERLLLGAISGFASTLPMTLAMRHLHKSLPAREKYPLPPREISETLPTLGMTSSAATVLHHFLYGALAGSAFAVMSGRRDIGVGASFGVAVWMASYLGWLPATKVLSHAAHHPPHRNRLMIASHLVWGACLAIGLRELEKAQVEVFSRSKSPVPILKDRPKD